MKPYQSNESSSKVVFFLLFAQPTTLTKHQTSIHAEVFQLPAKVFQMVVNNKGSTTLQDDATHPSPCLGWDAWPQFLLSFTRSQHGKHCHDSWFRGLGTLKIEILLKVRMFDELGFHSCHHCQVASEIVFCILQAALLCFAWRLC